MSERFTIIVNQSGLPEDAEHFFQWLSMHKGKKIMITAHDFWFDITRPQMNTIKGWARLIGDKTGDTLEDILKYAKKNLGYEDISDADLTSKEAHALMNELDHIALFFDPPVRLPYPKGWQRKDIYGEDNEPLS